MADGRWSAEALQVLESAWRRSARYLEQLEHRPVAPSPAAVAALERLNQPLPASGHAPERTLALLDELVSPATMAMAGPRFFGFVIGGTLPAALAANWLAGTWDQNAAFFGPTPGVARLEQIALRWLIELFDLPRESSGAFVTGATVSNFTALAAARHAVLARAGWNVEADGLFGAPPITVLVGDEAHPSLLKSLGMLGLGRSRVVRVPVDGQGRMRAEALPAIHGPAILCLQAGNVNTGAMRSAAGAGGGGTAPGRLGARRWRLRAVGQGLAAAAGPGRAASSPPIPGRPTRTSGSTCLTTAAWRWCAMQARCQAAMADDSRVPACGRSRAQSMRSSPRSCRGARAGSRCGRPCTASVARGSAELVERNCAQARLFATASARCRLPRAQRGGAEPGAGELRRRSAHARRGRSAAARRAPAGAASRSGRGAPRCASASATGRRTEQDVERSVAAMLRVARG